MFQKIKQKIKIAKITGIVIWILFVAMLVSNVYLLCEVNKIKKADYTCPHKTECQQHNSTCPYKK